MDRHGPEAVDESGCPAAFRVPCPQLALSVAAPGKDLRGCCDAERVRKPTDHLAHMHSLQTNAPYVNIS